MKEKELMCLNKQYAMNTHWEVRLQFFPTSVLDGASRSCRLTSRVNSSRYPRVRRVDGPHGRSWCRMRSDKSLVPVESQTPVTQLAAESPYLLYYPASNPFQIEIGPVDRTYILARNDVYKRQRIVKQNDHKRGRCCSRVEELVT
jgi:hypothetical protein